MEVALLELLAKTYPVLVPLIGLVVYILYLVQKDKDAIMKERTSYYAKLSDRLISMEAKIDTQKQDSRRAETDLKHALEKIDDKLAGAVTKIEFIDRALCATPIQQIQPIQTIQPITLPRRPE